MNLIYALKAFWTIICGNAHVYCDNYFHSVDGKYKESYVCIINLIERYNELIEKKTGMPEGFREQAIAATGDRINLLRAFNARYREALEELVFLKAHKDIHGKDDFYINMQPLAWQKVEQALKCQEMHVDVMNIVRGGLDNNPA